MSHTHRLTSTVALKVLRENYITKIRDIKDPETRKLCAKVCNELTLLLVGVDDIEKEEKTPT